MGGGQIATREYSTIENGTPEVGAGKVGAHEIKLDLGMLSSPLAPLLDIPPKDLQLLRVGHNSIYFFLI